MAKSSRRCGLTLVEVLVVIAIVGLIIAMLLPAVQFGREASRRAACANNLKQLGLALAGFEAAHGRLPPCGFSGGPSHFVHLLPYMEQRVLHDRFDLDKPHDPAQSTVRNSSLDMLLCPSDWLPSPVATRTNYAGSLGSLTTSTLGDGPFAFKADRSPEMVRLSDIIDGTSSTSAIAEWLPGHFLSRESSERRSMFDLRSTPDTTASGADFRDQCTSVDVGNFPNWRVNNTKGLTWQGGGYQTLYNHVMSPNQRSCYRPGPPTQGGVAAASAHPGGVNVLLLDGHVRFVKQSIAIGTWRALGSRNGGEIIGSDWY